MRRTKIVCTLGPSSTTLEDIHELAKAGMNVARINLSHGKREDRLKMLEIIRTLRKESLTISIMFDTKGAEIRTGEVEHPLPITKGQEVIFSPNRLENEKRTVISVNYSGFSQDVRETNRILLDNGEMIFDIVKINDDGTVTARSQNEGQIGSRRHITLPGADIDLPSLTQQDWDDIAFGAEQDVDYFSLSFIRRAEEIQEVRDFLTKHKSAARIITKIETKQAVANIAEIIAVSDGIMVARGDLGSDLPFEDLPSIQDEIVSRCHDAGVPVIVATHMLESMIEHPSPTRAEVTDVAHAAMTRSDATMLSGETANGKYPFKAVEAMDRILRKTESYLQRFPLSPVVGVRNDREARAEAAVSLAFATNATALLVFTKSGQTAREVSKFRPNVPVIALTNSTSTQYKLCLSYGVLPLVIPFSDPESTVHEGMRAAVESGTVSSGQNVVLLSDMQTKDAPVQSVQTRTLA
ncbi:MAG: pyruvate kinase [Candidatus Peribacteraceae bacterium]|nr:pyruvate kinase [Candidatus Peribacteraceae bacterium]